MVSPRIIGELSVSVGPKSLTLAIVVGKSYCCCVVSVIFSVGVFLV